MKFGQRVAAFARTHSGCDQTHNVDMYREAVVPPADRGTPFEKQYFFGNPQLSTCALFADQCLLAGEVVQQAPIDLVLHDHYVIGAAVGNVEWVGGQHAALETYATPGTRPDEPFAEGDCVVICGPPWGVHVIVNVEDAELLPDGRWRCKSVEGGQANGGVQAFEHFWEVRADGNMYPSGTSQRRVIAVIRARKFGYDLDERKDDDKTYPAPPDDTGAAA